MSLSSHIMITSTNGCYKRRRLGHGRREHVVYECPVMVLDLQIPRNVGSVQWKADLIYDIVPGLILTNSVYNVTGYTTAPSQTYPLRFWMGILTTAVCLNNPRSGISVSALCSLCGTGEHEDRDNDAIQAENFCKDEDENHADIETWLLRTGTDSSITNDSNSKTSGHTTQSNRDTSSELQESCVDRHPLFNVVGHDDACDKSVYGQDLGHDGT